MARKTPGLSNPQKRPRAIGRREARFDQCTKEVKHPWPVLYCIVLYCIVLYCIVLYCTVYAPFEQIRPIAHAWRKKRVGRAIH